MADTLAGANDNTSVRRYQTRSSILASPIQNNNSNSTISNSGASPDTANLRKRKAMSMSPPKAKPTKFKTVTSRTSSEERKTTPSTKAANTGFGKGRGTRVTDKHILFWGGPLSNWNLGSAFPGKRVVELLLPRFDEQGLDYPKATSLATRLLERHEFLCGEQAMMAFKAWLFERDASLEKDVAELALNDDVKTEDLLDTILKPSSVSLEIPEHLHEIIKLSRKTSLLRILHTPSPRDQKSLGRKVPHFLPEVWDKACMPIVVAASIARSECDEDLAKMYRQAGGGKRSFVEGSPMDRIWGVGLRWDDPRADMEAEWKGRNLLGRCHDEAAAFLRQAAEEEVDGAGKREG